MASNELVTLRRYHIVRQTEKGICIHVDFKFNTTMEGGASVWFPLKLFHNGAVPRWLVREKEEELAAEGGYKSCEILIDEADIIDKSEFRDDEGAFDHIGD